MGKTNSPYGPNYYEMKKMREYERSQKDKKHILLEDIAKELKNISSNTSNFSKTIDRR